MEGERPADASPDPESFTNRKRSRNEHPNPYCHTAPMSAEIRGRRRRRRLGRDQAIQPMGQPLIHDERGNARAQLLTIERVAVLKRVGLFADVPGHDAGRGGPLARGGVVRAPATGSSSAAVSRTGCSSSPKAGSASTSASMTLLESGPGGVVGEFALLAPAPRSASATAIEPSLLLRLRRGPFEELLDDHPEISRAVISTLARLLQAVADNHADPASGVSGADSRGDVAAAGRSCCWPVRGSRSVSRWPGS